MSSFAIGSNKSIKISVKYKSDSAIFVKKKISCKLSEDPPDASTQIKNQSHPSEVELAFVEFYDVEIKIGSEVFKVHRAHLIQHCTYFEKIFEKNTLPFVSLELDPDIGVTAPEFQLILKWIYKGQIPLQMTNFDAILKTANKFGMQGLIIKCHKFLLDLCGSRGLMLVYEQAAARGLEGIKYFAMRYASRNFLWLVATPQFLGYSQTQIILLLSNDHLAIPNEKCVYDAAVSWLKSRWRTRRASAAKVMLCVRFSTMSLEELKECCRPQDAFIIQNPSVIGPFFKALLYRIAEKNGQQANFETLRSKSLKFRSTIASSRLDHFTSRLIYRMLLTEVDSAQGQAKISKAGLRRTKSSIL